MDYSELIAVLDRASSFDLYRLREAINVLLDDPERMLTIKKQLKAGNSVEYFEPNENRLVSAAVLKLNRTRVLVRNYDDGQQWNIPYYFINLKGVDVDIQNSKDAVGLNKNEIKVGDRVGFHNHRTGEELYGEVIRRNQKTVTVDTKNDQQWRVGYRYLFSVLEQKEKRVERLLNNQASPE